MVGSGEPQHDVEKEKKEREKTIKAVCAPLPFLSLARSQKETILEARRFQCSVGNKSSESESIEHSYKSERCSSQW